MFLKKWKKSNGYGGPICPLYFKYYSFLRIIAKKKKIHSWEEEYQI